MNINLNQFLNTLRYIIGFCRAPKRLLLTRGLKNIRTDDGRSLRILGNGSSLLEALDILESDSADYMVLNRHVLSNSFISLRPKYYVIADPHFFLHEEGKSILEKIIQDTTWEMTLFLPYAISKKFFCQNKKINIVKFNEIQYSGFDAIKLFVFRNNLGMPLVQNVLVACIYIAICLNFKKIELYGVEHSWTKNLFVNDLNQVCLINPHFYDKEKSSPSRWFDIQHQEARLCDVLRMYAAMFESYYELSTFAKKEGVLVINRTRDSFIDAFDRN